jgi:hypothetical protein
MNAQQQAKLNELTQVHAAKITFAAELRSRIEAELAQKGRDYELRESRLMNEAVALGVPKTVVGRAVGLANWNVLAAKYALTADEYIAEPVAEQFVVDTQLSTLTVNWYEFTDGERIEETVTVPIQGNGFAKWDLTTSKDAYSLKVQQLAASEDYVAIGDFSYSLNDAILEAGVVVE